MGRLDSIPLTAHPLRFTARAETDIVFHEFAGSALRGALAQVLRRTFCPEWRAGQTDVLHRALCPVCQLLSWERDTDTEGDVRRPYTLTPPLNAPARIEAGETFTFGLTLFGEKLAYLPYLVLAVRGMGDEGVGRRQDNGQRGRFSLERIDAVNHLTGATRTLLAPGRAEVSTQTEPVTHAHVLQAAADLLVRLAAHDGQLTLHFHTPLRLTQHKALQKQPFFAPLIKHVARRVLDLCAQHAGGRPAAVELKRDLFPEAQTVQMVANHTQWWDLAGYSSRLHRKQQLGGLIGSATYVAADWAPLLPWLVWGQVTQVGKNTVKGCGIYTIAQAMVVT